MKSSSKIKSENCGRLPFSAYTATLGVENHTGETFPLSSMETQQEEEDQKKEIKTGYLNRDNEGIYQQVKAESIQLSSLA
jgi:hypothetical protein